MNIRTVALFLLTSLLATPLAADAPDDEQPPVAGFRAYGGTWTVDNGVLTAAAEAGPKLISVEPSVGIGDTGVEMLLAAGHAGMAGLVVKVSEPDVGADAFDGYEIAVDAQRQEVRLGRHCHNFKLIRDLPCAVPVGRWFPLAVHMTETALAIEVDGREVLKYDDPAHPLRRGSVGFRVWQREARYRNFWIRSAGKTRAIALAAPQPHAPEHGRKAYGSIACRASPSSPGRSSAGHPPWARICGPLSRGGRDAASASSIPAAANRPPRPSSRIPPARSTT